MLLSIVIPVYNEEQNIAKLLTKLNELNLDLEKEIILVDDCSTDRTLDNVHAFASKIPIKIFKLEKNSGKGAALKKGFKEANGDFVIIQDADLEYEPKDYPLLLKPLIDLNADVVYGSRFAGAGVRRVTNSLHYFANRFLTIFSNMVYGLSLSDMETCYKVFRKNILAKITIKENRFGIEPEITAKISKIPNLKLFEVPINYYARDYAEGKKIKWTDGLKAIFYIIKHRFID
ncbi:MAG: glycosyltransferase family 2 protein [Candidatus Caenarcaniphilales bacterium]|jgi:glycosyltransferase involved in cell wall biosynthesis|nr:glycosyltransferase family 2 protein [Candidatus Caenarcaniphilales bacterium]